MNNILFFLNRMFASTNDGFQIVGKKKKKGKSKSNNSSQFGGQSVKQTVRYDPNTKASVPAKEATNLGNTSKSPFMVKNQPPKVNVPSNNEGKITMSNSYAALDDESDEDVENVYDESANLFHSTQTSECSSTFTATAVKGLSECKASESNVRRIQVKDIVKEVKDYLKTYSSAGMDNNWYVEGIC
ncbi:hypothetical protein Tco_0685902 [Tanacetum coccineum]